MVGKLYCIKPSVHYSKDKVGVGLFRLLSCYTLARREGIVIEGIKTTTRIYNYIAVVSIVNVLS